MTTVTTRRIVDSADVARWTTCRSDVVSEVLDSDGPGSHDEASPSGTHRFSAESGPFRRYERTVVVTPDGDGRSTIDQTVTFRLGLGMWSVLFRGPMRATLRRAAGRTPWWAPPDVLDRQAAASLASLGTLSLIAGYVATLLTQTLTYAADEFGSGKRAQGDTLAAVRIGVLASMVIASWADRNGRRRALLGCAIGAITMHATTAVAPNLAILGLAQTLARGMSTALTLLIVVVVAEEMPAGSRAYGVSLLTMAGGLGGGGVLILLPLVESDPRAWRILFAVPLLFLMLMPSTARLLPESRRFVRSHADAHFGGHWKRLALLAGTSFSLAVFSSPATQLQNEFLRERFDFSAARITLFTVLTVSPGGLGIVLGGRLADVHGKRLIGLIGVVGGTVGSAAMYVSSSQPLLWTMSAVGAVVGGLAVPALSIYGPELFPTALRTKANVAITVIAVCGSVLGLLIAGRLAERWSLGPALASLAIAPAIVATVLIPRYPETSHRELEDLNPEDVV